MKKSIIIMVMAVVFMASSFVSFVQAEDAVHQAIVKYNLEYLDHGNLVKFGSEMERFADTALITVDGREKCYDLALGFYNGQPQYQQVVAQKLYDLTGSEKYMKYIPNANYWETKIAEAMADSNYEAVRDNMLVYEGLSGETQITKQARCWVLKYNLKKASDPGDTMIYQSALRRNGC